MTEIEFLDPDRARGPAGAEADPSDGDAAGPDLRRLVPALAAAVAWVLAAGLAVMASVSTVYSLAFGRTTISVDAWGRFDAPRLVQSVGHQTRYAIVLIAVAVLLLAAALVGIVRLEVARYLAVGGTALAGGLALTLYLFVDATRSTNSARTSELASGVSLHTETGSAVWLTLAATAAAAVGIVLAFVLKAPADQTDEAVEGWADEPTAGYPAEAVQPVPGGAGGGGVAAG